jgi:hypothetical protein
MSDWQQHALQDKIVQILAAVPEYKTEHHFERPYLSAYQIAIKIAEQHPTEFSQMGRLIGGSGAGEQNSLAWYIADQLSKRIHSGEITNIQGGFIRTDYMIDVAFNFQGTRIEPSTLPTLTIFRFSE